MKLPLAAALMIPMFLSGCDNSEPFEAKNPQRPLVGEWKETVPKDVIYFAGGTLVVTFSQDSVLLKERKFTDVSSCLVTDGEELCSDLHWENQYRGTWIADDSLLTLSFAFTGTTANRLTPDERMADGTFRMRYALKGTGDLALSKLKEGAFLPERDGMNLVRQ